MNRHDTRVPTQFGPETAFELTPRVKSAVPGDSARDLEQLKNRLLRRHLHATEDLALLPGLRRAANEAAALAWLTAYPLLVLPGLLEEKMVAARRQHSLQQHIRGRTRTFWPQAA